MDANDRLLAAKLVAIDAISDRQIAERVGIARSTLSEWKNDETFHGMVNDAREAYFKMVLRSDYGNKQRRITKLAQLAGRIEMIIKERAEDPAMTTVIGGGSGLLAVSTTTTINGTTTVSVEFDAALSREFRDLIRQIDEMSGTEIPPEIKKSKLDLSKLTVEELRTIDTLLARAKPSVGSAEEGAGR